MFKVSITWIDYTAIRLPVGPAHCKQNSTVDKYSLGLYRLLGLVHVEPKPAGAPVYSIAMKDNSVAYHLQQTSNVYRPLFVTDNTKNSTRYT